MFKKGFTGQTHMVPDKDREHFRNPEPTQTRINYILLIADH